MKQFFKDERGNILVFSALATFSLMAFASIAIDVGCMLTARNQLQSAVDASALAGASGLMQNQTEAIETAINIAGHNTCLNQSITLGMGDIHFPTYNQVQVQASQTVDLYFAKVLGMETAQISAVAAAEIGTIISTRGMKPWAVPDIGYQHGQSVVIKSGSLGAPATVPSFFYPIDFPPLNRGTPVPGANEYMENVMHGSSGFVGVNDIIQVEPGNMVGPTKKGVDYLIAQDPGAYWDGNQVTNSLYPGTTSPRIIKLPLYDPNDPPSPGRSTITVTRLASFFVQRMQGKDVIGVFVDKISGGTFGGGNSMLKASRLIL